MRISDWSSDVCSSDLLLNASKFALSFGSTSGGAVTEPLDRSMLVALAALVDDATAAFDRYDYARALERTESHFWAFCDDYLELVKNRAYDEGEGAESAKSALGLALEVLLKLFAPRSEEQPTELQSLMRKSY